MNKKLSILDELGAALIGEEEFKKFKKEAFDAVDVFQNKINEERDNIVKQLGYNNDSISDAKKMVELGYKAGEIKKNNFSCNSSINYLVRKTKEDYEYIGGFIVTINAKDSVITTKQITEKELLKYVIYNDLD
jgi:hypothetical protein